MNIKLQFRKGFTLVELLIVVTLIAILAIAVLAAIDPIEQINKSRDTARRADATQLLNAIDRFYTNSERFPWNALATPPNYNVQAYFSGRAQDLTVGVCATGNNTSGSIANGTLVTSGELKDGFGKRNMFKTDAAKSPYDNFVMVKPLNSTSISICYIPSSKKERADLTNLHSITNLTSGVPSATTTIGACATAPTDWSAQDTSCYICVPQ